VSGMGRRQFITLLGGAAAWPLPTHAQQAAKPTIGLLVPGTPASHGHWYAATVQRLRELGWVEGRTIAVEYRWAEGFGERLPELAADLVQLKVHVIVTGGSTAVIAAKQATSSIPIVFAAAADPVGSGLVASLARPGGNVTGLSFMGTEVAGKQVELLKEAVPSLTSVAVLVNPTNASHPPRTKEVMTAARTLRLQVEVVEAATRPEIVDAVRTMVKRGAGAALVLADPTFVVETSNVIRAAAEQRLPVMYGLREAPLAGGLMSYGPSFADLFRRAGGYVDKILRGAKPQDLPIEQASKFEFVINLKTAKALGLTIPPSLLARADQVIQ
jgi:putative tryptophan/tyrosine transport system substrate-binding protein